MGDENAKRLGDYANRLLDEMPRAYPEVHVRLIDALREYIRSCETDGEDMLRDGSITKERYRAGMEALLKYRQILGELEKFNVDPTLHGALKR